ncbi:glyoxal reductase [Pristis pectinata]|uniref:glyoxal reductase n=1 Tax=Pristis pectinata TaxID=685728 RepID=UPI00223DF4CC|nr:glyoxal reductase [Pristis pectinata]XP_051901265.1 glyoxal reductase [Pristis pectinata]
MERVRLNNGIEMPLVGLGTFKLRGYDIVYQALDAALAHGYRSFDTASVYQNEADIGKALKDLLPKHGLSRQDLFITSKLAPKDHGREGEAGCLRSLEALDCEYLDLYLIHWPGKQGHKSEDSQNPAWRQESWETMERLYGSGSFRAIGVSNYTVGHLQELLARCHVKPAVLQVEYHPHLVQEELLAFCLANGIHLQAYSSLGTGYLITEPKVEALATKYSKTPAQVLLRWALQQGIGVIPKSSNPERIAQNFQLFDFSLGKEDMEVLNGMHSDTRYCWDPRHVV